MHEFTSRNLNKIAEFEQELATGVNEKGNTSRLILQSLLSSLDDVKIEYVLPSNPYPVKQINYD
jgi:hypothetical protein